MNCIENNTHVEKIEGKLMDLFLKASKVDSLLEVVIAQLGNKPTSEEIHSVVNAMEGIKNYHRTAVTNSAFEIVDGGINCWLQETV